MVALTLSPTALADRSHAIKVLGTNGKVIATFHSAKCLKNKNGFFATTPHANGESYLHVRVEDFTGFHDYKLVQGGNADPYVVFAKGDGTRYSNLNRPPFPSHGGGELRFRDHGGLMGVGYSPAYSSDGADAVSFTGVVECKYRNR